MSHEIAVSESLREFARDCNPRMIFGEPARAGLGGKVLHVENVERICEQLADDANVNRELLLICARLHDLGRSVQWKATQSFSDRVVNHRYLGLQMVEQWLREHQIYPVRDWKVAIDVMQYHGLKHMEGFVHYYALPYVRLISLADDTENGCCGALGYLEDEKLRDDKGYIKTDPARDQRDLNPDLLGYLERGEKFNKMTMCHTYAEYFVFAAMLAVNAVNAAPEIAKKAMKDKCYYDEEHKVWLNAVEGYCHIFQKHLHEADAATACEIMRRKCI